MKEAGVQYILNLADNDEKIKGYLAKEDFASPYFLTLYENGSVDSIALNMNFSSEDFRAKVASGLARMAERSGPYLVHCTEGKDRTGFVCLLLEALCGASYEEIVDDYMITYDNYYQISKDEKGLNASHSLLQSYYQLKESQNSVRYTVIVENVLNPMVQVLAGNETDLAKADLQAGAEAFLLSGGMSKEQISALQAALCGK